MRSVPGLADVVPVTDVVLVTGLADVVPVTDVVLVTGLAVVAKAVTAAGVL